MALPVIRVVLDGGREQSVDKGGLAESRFASNLCARFSSCRVFVHRDPYHQSEGSTTFGHNLVSALSFSFEYQMLLLLSRHTAGLEAMHRVSHCNYIAKAQRWAYIGNANRRAGLH